jgi:CubicO group peptidase (beta-lactamase class C family)
MLQLRRVCWLVLACNFLLQVNAVIRAADVAIAQEIAEALEPIRAKHQLPALSGAIVKNQGLLAAAAVGKRRADRADLATTDDLWHMGSCTKAMTATMIATLVEERKLNWDSTIEQSFPDYADRWPAQFRQVTLLHLLSHRSGLPSNLAWGSFPRETPLETQRNEALRRLIPIQMVAKPGAKFEYSNIGYLVAGIMAERATKTGYEELMQRRVFQPLGMNNATYGNLENMTNTKLAWPHTREGRPFGETAPISKDTTSEDSAISFQQTLETFSNRANEMLLSYVLGPDGDAPVAGPAGSTLRVTLDDWAKFVADQLRGDRGEQGLLKPETYQILHKLHFGGEYALGWGVRSRPEAGGRMLLHSGSNGMNFSVVRIIPDRDFAVLVCTNQAGEPGTNATREAADRLIKLHEKHFPTAKPADQ